MKIEGYFSNIKTANEVVGKLKSEGFKGAFTDINEHMNNAYTKSGVLGSRDISSMSQAIFGDEQGSSLAAASPMASGMGGFEEIANVNCKVVVEAKDRDTENAREIIRRMGGTTEDPNGGIPRGLENIDEDDLILKNLRG
ncbi:hypothetical protein CLHOM_35260 [Clostridium homopropionicum DSM 5847]|uniref:Uncharacterized protein n=1 Tax=Clostridium homopropionicum DSM 5847 TaxID=1121318 RepID=A0A0L6Z538_9CLOT|nr:hypothetical protein [Clostridium homopropionicum]KOA18075.1 hypothetical protein CLHOM_35260 [Clostridium homopropionicum DSM 5847]SFG71196.1 hypothetical protein SAMN04488501_1147 [Clostridium homopropionicum]